MGAKKRPAPGPGAGPPSAAGGPRLAVRRARPGGGPCPRAARAVSSLSEAVAGRYGPGAPRGRVVFHESWASPGADSGSSTADPADILRGKHRLATQTAAHRKALTMTFTVEIWCAAVLLARNSLMMIPEIHPLSIAAWLIVCRRLYAALSLHT